MIVESRIWVHGALPSSRHLLGEMSSKEFAECNRSSDERESPSSDPMMWYGSLVPSQLKSCKENFELVMKHVDQLVQLQCKLNSNLVRLKQ
jgi:galactokinase